MASMASTASAERAAAERTAAPVEYGVAVDRFLAAARISAASRRVYRVALSTWGWLLVDRVPPSGAARRGAQSPVILLSRLDGTDGARNAVRALNRRALMVDRRTFAREASILRNAAHWWAARGWIRADAEAAVKAYVPPPAAAPSPDAASPLGAPLVIASPAAASPALDAHRVEAVFRLHAPLREQALWRLVHESGAPVEHLLALDASDLDLTRRSVRQRAVPRPADRISWGPLSAELLPLLTIGRTTGPVFLTERRAAAHVPKADRCPYTGRARLSPRRAAELFQSATSALDPSGRGWNLRDLRVAGRQARTR